MNKPQITHVVPSFGLGGMERIICSIINHTSERYHHKLIILDKNKQAFQWITTAIEDVAFHKPEQNLLFLKKLRHTLGGLQTDFLMTYNWGATDAIWLGRLRGLKKIIHNEHGFNIDEAHFTSKKRDLIRFLLYRIASRTIVVSQSLKMMMQVKYHLKEDKLAFIPNGLDIQLYKNDKDHNLKMRNELGIETTDFVLGFSGRLDPVKNFDLMLRIFGFCLQQETGFKLLIIGDGPERERLESLCQHQEISDHVIFSGQRNDILPYLGCMDMFLLTSFREQMPMSVLESMAMGIPVLATDVGDLSCMIEDKKNGFIRSLHDNLEEFARPIFCMKKHREHARMIGLMAQKKVAMYQENHMIQRYIDVIEKC